MRRALSLSFALTALFGVPHLARAQSVPSPYRYVERAQSLGVDAGYLNIDAGTYDVNPRSGPLIQIQYQGRFAGPVSGVVTLGAVPTDRPVYTRASGADSGTKLDEASSLLLLAEAGLRLSITGPRTWHGLQPAIAATGGFVGDLGGRTEIETQLGGDQLVALGPAFAVGLSAGTDWYPTDRLSVRLQAADHLWRRRTPAGLTDSGARETEWTHNLGITVGAALHF
jgi:hypothetical protein